MGSINESEIRKAIEIIKPDGKIFEVRILYGKKTASGYFNNADTLIKALKKMNLSGANVYFTLNYINKACFDRSQKNKFEMPPKSTTSDNDIDGYEWLMIDLDPRRPSDTASSDEELDKAKELSNKVYHYMRNKGFEKPLVALSGNGVHLLYRISLENNAENKRLIERCLKSLDLLFSNDSIAIDTAVFNPSRICKLYGTLSSKGSNSEERPHRFAKIVGNYTEIKPTRLAYLKELANEIPEESEKPQKYNNYNPTAFDVGDWLTRFGVGYKTTNYAGGTKYILDCCPFDPNHKDKDACVFRVSNGAIGFKCLHASCSDKKWSDLRKLYEPDAYEKKQMETQKMLYKSFNRDRKAESKPIIETDDKPIFRTALDIFELPKVEESFVRTGYDIIDKKLRGLKKGYVSVWSGTRGSAKSTVLSQICIEAVNSGNNTAVFSGELSEKNFWRWMVLQTAGRGYVEPSQYEGYFNVPWNFQRDIAVWFGKHFWLYNNDYGNDAQAIIDVFEKAIEEKSLDLLILDNLMAFNLSTINDNKWEAQTQFVWKLHELAQRTNVHIAFVAHPRKSLGFIRLEDISGTADLANAVEDAFIVHRVNHDFITRTKQEFGWDDEHECYRCTNVIEICKDRDGGTQDVFVPLYYEPETKRLKNYFAESKVYGWLTQKEVKSDTNDSQQIAFNEGFVSYDEFSEL